jgi:hypothetical protein
MGVILLWIDAPEMKVTDGDRPALIAQTVVVGALLLTTGMNRPKCDTGQ